MRTSLILLIILSSISSPAWAKKKAFTTAGDIGQVLIPAAAAYMTYSKNDPEGTGNF